MQTLNICLKNAVDYESMLNSRAKLMKSTVDSAIAKSIFSKKVMWVKFVSYVLC